MTSNEIVVSNLNRIGELYTVLGVLTEKRNNEEDWDMRGSYNRAIIGIEDAIENLTYVNKALEDC